MIVWRLQDAKYPVVNAEGARLTGGRWNEPGTPVIYASDTVTLAALEVMVHHGGIPANYVGIEITVPPDVIVFEPDIPPGWPDLVPEAVTAAMGTRWVQSNEHAVMKVPSRTMSLAGYNYVLNPAHQDFARIVFARHEITIAPQLRM